MTPKERYDRFEVQPEYMKNWVAGLSEAQYYHVVMESKNFAIVQRDGHSWYKGAWGAQMQYAPVKYWFISKTIKNYWHERGKELDVKGRINRKSREYFSMLLASGERCK